MSDRDQQGKETRRAFLVEAREQPLGVDVSDFGDEFVEGFLNGQENALEFIELVLDGTMATFQQARFVKPWLEALPGASVEPVPAPRLEWREGPDDSWTVGRWCVKDWGSYSDVWIESCEGWLRITERGDLESAKAVVQSLEDVLRGS